jgi:hypothetical protein
MFSDTPDRCKFATFTATNGVRRDDRAWDEMLCQGMSWNRRVLRLQNEAERPENGRLSQNCTFSTLELPQSEILRRRGTIATVTQLDLDRRRTFSFLWLRFTGQSKK